MGDIENLSIEELSEQNTPKGWEIPFELCIKKNEFKGISNIIKREEKKYGKCLPLRSDMFKSLELTPLKEVRVIIFGNYPCHFSYNDVPADIGLSYSIRKGFPLTNTLVNIFNEIKNSYSNFIIPKHGDLSSWCKQGVLLLNLSLTVRKNKPNTHKVLWYSVIKEIIKSIEKERKKPIFLLWGKTAQEIATEFISNKSIILETSHPSQYGYKRGFKGCGHFKKVNDLLIERGETPINWQI